MIIDDYSIINREGQYYIVFDDISIYERGNTGFAYVDFLTLGEMKEKILEGKLTGSDKVRIVRVFERDEFGIPIYDFNNMYVPVLPEGWVSDDDVSWYGAHYSLSVDTDYASNVYYRFITQQRYDSMFQYDYENPHGRGTIHIGEPEQIDGKEYTMYVTETAKIMKRVRYELIENDKKITVEKKYTLKTEDSPLPSKPDEIYLYCEEGEARYIIKMYAPTEDPTDEWLMQFGAKPYVDDTDSESSESDSIDTESSDEEDTSESSTVMIEFDYEPYKSRSMEEFRSDWMAAQNNPDDEYLYCENGKTVVPVSISDRYVIGCIEFNSTTSIYYFLSTENNDGETLGYPVEILVSKNPTKSYEDWIAEKDLIHFDGKAYDDSAGYVTWYIEYNNTVVTICFYGNFAITDPDELDEYFAFEEWSVESESITDTVSDTYSIQTE